MGQNTLVSGKTAYPKDVGYKFSIRVNTKVTGKRVIKMVMDI